MTSPLKNSAAHFLRELRGYLLLLALAIIFQRLFPSALAFLWILWVLVGAFLERFRTVAKSHRVKQARQPSQFGIGKWSLISIGGVLFVGLLVGLVPPTILGVSGIAIYVNPEKLHAEIIMIPAVIFGYFHRGFGQILVHNLTQAGHRLKSPDWPERLRLILIVLVLLLVGIAFVVGGDSLLAWTILLYHFLNLLLSYLSMRKEEDRSHIEALGPG